MYKWLMSVLFFGACAFGLIFLAVTAAPEKSEDELAAADGVKQLKLVASNFQFDQAEYKVAVGEKLKVVLTNKEGKHGVEIEGQGLSFELGGKEMSKEVTFDKAGTYSIVCSVPCGDGHVTMKSKIVVA
jgi:cytochrome c oxidase subunit 2